jgi:hypothetical protein
VATRRALIALAALVAGAIVIYAVAVGHGVFGYTWLPGLPYEQLLGKMCAGGVVAAGLAVFVTRPRR